MINRIRNMINRIRNIINRANSYSQYGEDNIILLMIGLYNIQKTKYMDIGAHHPFKYSNTALLYKHGIYGINIEPDPLLFRRFIKNRKNDTNLNIGISNVCGESILYQFEKPEFNTFSEKAAQEIENKGIKKTGEKKVKLDTYNNVVDTYLNGKAPDILFLDAEGLDEIIIGSIDFERYCPKIICIETYAYGVGKKNYEVIKFLLNKHFSIHADTYVNTIFIQSDIAKNILS